MTGETQRTDSWLETENFKRNCETKLFIRSVSAGIFRSQAKISETSSSFKVCRFGRKQEYELKVTLVMVFATEKLFGDFTTVARCREVSFIYIKHNLFRKSQIGRGVGPLKTEIVLLKPPCVVIQSLR